MTTREKIALAFRQADEPWWIGASLWAGIALCGFLCWLVLA